jgi:hypothetical protein
MLMKWRLAPRVAQSPGCAAGLARDTAKPFGEARSRAGAFLRGARPDPASATLPQRVFAEAVVSLSA